MKKLLLLLLSLTFVVVLAACGSDDSSSNDTSDNTEDQSGSSENENVAEEETEPENEGNTSPDVIENEAGTFTAHTKFEEPQTHKTGPIVLTINKVVTASGELVEEMASILETDQLEYIQVDISVENTSEDDITFYAGQGKISTNTGEQLDPNMFLSGHIDGDLMSGTKANDTFFYVLENSKAEDVESIRMVFSAPHGTESFEDVGEKLDFEIQLK
ncbi:DUF4352 domain-containing protein [Lentibacillus saliphilus]|uniref:DUF4352 domain-containing protein n=1 Tax=Lentibacillus saliphilus TaxID=2737028 RepID=UPI001C30FF80|nr:DUF4352 domain-containing protein [Lentibacillus saliphilus]